MPRWDGVQENIGEIVALKRQEFRNVAQETLEKIYRYVLPIMKKYNYRVHKLCEFLPKTQNLLGVNVNHGQRISLRLRYHHNPQEFLPFDHVLGTMLHELCHNTYGPHDQDFFRLLDKLTNEMESLIAGGFTGDPFIGHGQMVGGSPLSTMFVNNTTPSNRVLQSSNVARKPLISPYGLKSKQNKGRKLGGLRVKKLRSCDHEVKRELLLKAAERRREADISCRNVRCSNELTHDEEGDVIDLTDDLPKNPKNENKTKTEINDKTESMTKLHIDSEVIYILDD